MSHTERCQALAFPALKGIIQPRASSGSNSGLLEAVHNLISKENN